MVWNFFDSWVPKRHQKKQLKCTPADLTTQIHHCSELYDDWQLCVQMKGFNDESCKEEQLEKYYNCVAKQEAMKAYLEDEDLDKGK